MSEYLGQKIKSITIDEGSNTSLEDLKRLLCVDDTPAIKLIYRLGWDPISCGERDTGACSNKYPSESYHCSFDHNCGQDRN